MIPLIHFMPCPRFAGRIGASCLSDTALRLGPQVDLELGPVCLHASDVTLGVLARIGQGIAKANDAAEKQLSFNALAATTRVATAARREPAVALAEDPLCAASARPSAAALGAAAGRTVTARGE